ncbi:hypothetical protein ACFPOE_07945 [Caenimonas terrae]|uniref:DUF3153 domain-containing protein n=1 Tax=Caenimonas terrae TaxID=696074 RepID=A0ABW0NER4_9BURK
MMRLLALALLLGALAGCSRKTEINEVVASVEATSLQLDKMIASAKERKGKDPAFAEMPMATEPFVVKFKSGSHKVLWTLEGQQARTGPIDATIVATLGDGSGGRVLGCRLPSTREFPAGAAKMECESAPFRVEQDKTFILQTGLGKAEGFTPTRFSAQVAAVPVRVGWGGWFTAMIYAMVGAVMLVLWFVFFKR